MKRAGRPPWRPRRAGPGERGHRAGRRRPVGGRVRAPGAAWQRAASAGVRRSARGPRASAHPPHPSAPRRHAHAAHERRGAAQRARTRRAARRHAGDPLLGGAHAARGRGGSPPCPLTSGCRRMRCSIGTPCSSGSGGATVPAGGGGPIPLARPHRGAAPGAEDGLRQRGAARREGRSGSVRRTPRRRAPRRARAGSRTGRRRGRSRATWKIGASSSLLIATMTLLSFMPARCWMAPEMPTAR